MQAASFRSSLQGSHSYFPVFLRRFSMHMEKSRLEIIF